MKGGHPILVGFLDIPEGCSRLQFSPANGLKLLRLLAWGTAEDSLLSSITVAGEKGILQPMPLRLFASDVPTADLRSLGSALTLTEDKGPVFFHLRSIEPRGVALLKDAGNPVFLSTVLPGWGVTIDVAGPVSSLALFGYEAL